MKNWILLQKAYLSYTASHYELQSAELAHNRTKTATWITASQSISLQTEADRPIRQHRAGAIPKVRKNRTLTQIWANRPPRFGAKKHQSGSGSAARAGARRWANRGWG
jgi:hypothetical protein